MQSPKKLSVRRIKYCIAQRDSYPLRCINMGNAQTPATCISSALAPSDRVWMGAGALVLGSQEDIGVELICGYGSILSLMHGISIVA